MKPQSAYTYVVAQHRRKRAFWSLAVHLPGGAIERLAAYKSRAQAIDAARLLAYGSGRVVVRP